MRHWLPTVFLSCLLSAAALAGERPLVIAHRGASEDAPENTLAAFRLAWEQGADGIEGDFHLSRDGRIVCLHDKTTKRTAERNLEVRQATLAELQRLDVGRSKDPKFAGERMPTLEDVLAVVPPGKLIFVEVKCGPEIVPALRQTLQTTRLPRSQVRVIAFDADVIAAVKRELPDIRAYWLTDFHQKTRTGQKKRLGTDAVLKTLQATSADGMDGKADLKVVDEALVDRFHQAGHEFHVWTVDDLAVAEKLAAWGVDSITTNVPGLVRERLAEARENR